MWTGEKNTSRLHILQAVICNNNAKSVGVFLTKLLKSWASYFASSLCNNNAKSVSVFLTELLKSWA
jgi:hypothetical protein